jgi:hypothetical protein
MSVDRFPSGSTSGATLCQLSFRNSARVPGKKLDAPRGRVALAAAHRGAPGARASRAGTENRASEDGRGTVLAAKLLDLLVQPCQVLPDVSPISVHTAGSRARNYGVCDCYLVDGVA